MRHLFSSHTFLALSLIFLAFTLSHDHPMQSWDEVYSHGNRFKKVPKQDRIRQAMLQEFERTKDPDLNEVPRDRVLDAYRIAQRKRMEQGSTASRSAIGGVSWNERGPYDVAGRTRAVLMDAGDPTGHTVFAAGISGGLWKTTRFFETFPQWTPVDEFFETLVISCITQDPVRPDTIYFGTGEGWFTDIPFYSNAFAGIGIWKSVDGGATWSHLPSTQVPAFNYIQNLKVVGSDIYACTRNGGVQRSQDGGLTWTQVLGAGVGTGVTDMAADIELGPGGDLYATLGIFSVTDGIYKSNSGSTVGNPGTWTKLTTGLPDTGYARIEIACAPSNAGRVYAVYQDKHTSNALGVYRTNDGGNTWRVVENPTMCEYAALRNFTRWQAYYNMAIAVHPTDEEKLYIGGIDGFLSDNGGESWRQVTTWSEDGLELCHFAGQLINLSINDHYVHSDHHFAQFKSDNPNVLVLGTDGGIFLSTNAETTYPTFISKNQGFRVTQFYSCAIHPSESSHYLLAGSQDNGSLKFTDIGLGGTYEVSPGDGGTCHIDERDPFIQIVSYVNNWYFVSTNSGLTFQSYPFTQQNVNGDTHGSFINPTDYDSQNKYLYGASYDGKYFRWEGIFTQTTTDVTVTAFGNSEVTHVYVSPNVPNRVYFGLNTGEVVYVDNAHVDTSRPGTNISNTGSAPISAAGSVSCIAIEEGNENHILVTYSNYGVNSVWETKDGGNNWISVEGDLPDIPVRWAVFSPHSANHALLATELGVWSTTDLSATPVTWGPTIGGMANVRVDMLQVRKKDYTIAAATHGRGMYTTTIPNFLPVELLSFDGVQIETDARLTWTTAQEHNNSHFVIERSIDGSFFEPINEVKGVGNSNEASQYNYLDEHITRLGVDILYYRLKQFDTDGSSVYSNIIQLNIDRSQLQAVSLYPNPAQGVFYLEYMSPDASPLEVNVFNSTGQLMLTRHLSPTVSGGTLEIDGTGWNPGVYFVNFVTERKDITRRLLVR